MSHYKTYHAQKYSGVEWLGNVPSHWKVSPLCVLFERVKRTGCETEELLSVYRDHGVIPKTAREDNNNKASDDLSVYQLVELGNLVINKMKAWQGSIAISRYRGIVSPAYFVYKQKHQESHTYLHHLLRSLPYVVGYMSSSEGVRVGQWDLNPDLFRRFPVLIPPLKEQEAIAQHLDRETSRIDALVEQKIRFIELLSEKRQALIIHAVTKGLASNTPMKKSGVQWLGDVPKHWLIKKVAYWISSSGSGTTPSSEQDYCQEVEGGIPWVTTGELRENTILSTQRYVTPKAIENYSALKVHPSGSLVIAMYGATVGRLAILGKAASLNQACFAIHPCSSIKLDFLRYWIEGLRGELMEMATGAGQPNISADKIRNLIVAAPNTLKEQEEIVRFLVRETSLVDELIFKTERSIEFLKERRSALTTAVVTGQIDIRAVA